MKHGSNLQKLLSSQGNPLSIGQYYVRTFILMVHILLFMRSFLILLLNTSLFLSLCIYIYIYSIFYYLLFIFFKSFNSLVVTTAYFIHHIMVYMVSNLISPQFFKVCQRRKTQRKYCSAFIRFPQYLISLRVISVLQRDTSTYG